MSYAFQVPDETYQALRIIAQRQGRSPEDLFQEWVEAQRATEGSAATRRMRTHSLARFVGAFEADAPDLVRRHDYYIAAAAGEAHDGGA